MKRIIRPLGIVAISAVVATGLVACGSDSSAGGGLLANIEAGNVTIGTKYDQPGLGLREPDGSMTGFDVEVATYVVNAIAEENGWEQPEITWRETPSAQRETLIQNGEVDMIAATYSINASRAESVSFGGPYTLTHQALLVSADNEEVTALEDLDGKILCSVTGSTPAQKVKEELAGVQLQEYDTYASCVEALSQGNVDAITTDASILGGYAAQSPGEFKVVQLLRDGEEFTNEYYGIGVTKDDDAAVEAINAALQAMYDDGSFQTFIDRNLDGGAGVSEAEPGNLDFLQDS